MLEQKMSLRGTGGELLRGSVTSYIQVELGFFFKCSTNFSLAVSTFQNLSEAHFPCHSDDVVLDIWKMVLGELIRNTSYLCEKSHR
jgi:hypothetical protein